MPWGSESYRCHLSDPMTLSNSVEMSRVGTGDSGRMHHSRQMGGQPAVGINRPLDEARALLSTELTAGHSSQLFLAQLGF